jgi:glycerate 2-kinase
MVDNPRQFLQGLFNAAVAAVSPDRILPPFLPAKSRGRTIVLGAGKGSALMAKAVEDHWDGPLEGIVLTPYHHGADCKRIEIVEAAHPVPDAAGREAAGRILELAKSAGPDDLVLCLISGGGSALMALPAEGLTLEDKRAMNKALLKSGANIVEMNCVRKHLSAIKGGRLAQAASMARVVTLAVSDVPGDDPSVIASGPTVPDPTTFADALAILRKYGITEPAAAIEHLKAARQETPKPGDPLFAGNEVKIIATPQEALDAAAAFAVRHGVTPVVLGHTIEGEARDVALVHAGIARQAYHHGQPAKTPCVIISGGETTVTVKGGGRGGRNVEFLLALTVALDGHKGIYGVAGDTDGIDGIEPVAGAFMDPTTIARAAATGVKAKESLADNDGHGFFEAVGDQLVTGPTRTNVNDFRAILVQHEER